MESDMHSLTPQPDPRKARTPHRRQAFHQLPQGSKGTLRELNRQKQKRTSGPASDLRIGHRLESGEIVWFMTEREYTNYRSQVLANKHLEMAERKKRNQPTHVEVDSWAKKV